MAKCVNRLVNIFMWWLRSTTNFKCKSTLDVGETIHDLYNKKYKMGLLKSRTQGSASYLELFDDDAGVW